MFKRVLGRPLRRACGKTTRGGTARSCWATLLQRGARSLSLDYAHTAMVFNLDSSKPGLAEKAKVFWKIGEDHCTVCSGKAINGRLTHADPPGRSELLIEVIISWDGHITSVRAKESPLKNWPTEKTICGERRPLQKKRFSKVLYFALQI